MFIGKFLIVNGSIFFLEANVLNFDPTGQCITSSLPDEIECVVEIFPRTFTCTRIFSKEVSNNISLYKG